MGKKVKILTTGQSIRQGTCTAGCFNGSAFIRSSEMTSADETPKEHLRRVVKEKKVPDLRCLICSHPRYLLDSSRLLGLICQP